ncbi:MAG: NADH-quinone oxidoreductase subunit C [Nitrospirae bacterium]|nr:MAG: NADH-quinone oxidoreductase subunit C [Nitrospirota bacterium]
MEPLAIADKIKEQFPEEVLEIREFRGQVSVTLNKGRIGDICRFLHDDPALYFDFLVDLCGMDYLGKKEKRFAVVYNLYSVKHRHRIMLKAEVEESSPSIDSVMPIWIGVNWHERECYDLFGIVFRGHPDLRRVLLPEGWEGHPLRKDYPLKGPGPDQEWKGFNDVLDRSKQYREFDWHG